MMPVFSRLNCTLGRVLSILCRYGDAFIICFKDQTHVLWTLDVIWRLGSVCEHERHKCNYSMNMYRILSTKKAFATLPGGSSRHLSRFHQANHPKVDIPPRRFEIWWMSPGAWRSNWMTEQKTKPHKSKWLKEVNQTQLFWTVLAL